MIKENVLNTLYERIGIGGKTFCITCKKQENSYILIFEKKIKIRSKVKIADPSKSSSRKVILRACVQTHDFGTIDYNSLFYSLPGEEKKIFKALVIKIAGKVKK